MPNYNYLWLPPSIPTYFLAVKASASQPSLMFPQACFSKKRRRGLRWTAAMHVSYGRCKVAWWLCPVPGTHYDGATITLTGGVWTLHFVAVILVLLHRFWVCRPRLSWIRCDYRIIYTFVRCWFPVWPGQFVGWKMQWLLFSSCTENVFMILTSCSRGRLEVDSPTWRLTTGFFSSCGSEYVYSYCN